jgi:GntR family transcriptional regulator
MPLNHVHDLPVRINFKANTPPSIQLAGQINCIIAKGQLREGDLLPQIRKLAEQLDLNPNTVARAYEQLAQCGLLAKRQGSGCYVRRRPANRNPADRLKPLVDRIEELVTDAQAIGVTIPELIGEIRRHDLFENRPATGQPSAKPKGRALQPAAPVPPLAVSTSLWQAAGELLD